MTIAMPGHSLAGDAHAEQDLAELSAMVDAHDVVFLLTDTREARWLPTVLAAAHCMQTCNFFCKALKVLRTLCSRWRARREGARWTRRGPRECAIFSKNRKIENWMALRL